MFSLAGEAPTVAPFNAIPPLAARKGMTFDAVDFLLLFPPHCTFYIRKPIDVLCAHLGPSFFFFRLLLRSCRLANVTSHVFSPSRSNSQNKMGKKGEAKSCLHFGQNSLVELTALLTRPHVYFLHNTSSNSLSFFKKNRFTLTLKSFRVFYPLLPEQFRTLKASDVLMM